MSDIILLDRIAKGKNITDEQAKQLRQNKLIEGRKPNYIIAAKVAAVTDEKAAYIKQRGLDDTYYTQLIIDYLKKFKKATRSDIDAFLLDKLPEILDTPQKKHKTKNLLQKMKNNKKVKYRENKYWVLDEI